VKEGYLNQLDIKNC